MKLTRIAVPVLIAGAGASLLYAQTMIEYGVNAGRSGAAAAAAGAGKNATAVFGKVTDALTGAAKTSGAATPAKPAAAAPVASPVAVAAASPVITVAAAPAPKEEPAKPANLTALETGMNRNDMLTKVGKPSMSLSSVESSTLVETCWYKSGTDSVTVTLRDGKVASISGAEKLTAK